ncbi:MAG: NAD(P)-dependent oxidoreductase [Deltaproteobacteria bacterium]|jgi:nucleoside-diphosphate-sugar epimerase|nr:NAD(P)-dependent oxidoreductase [Deltaproteobacteria bacterium]
MPAPNPPPAGSGRQPGDPVPKSVLVVGGAGYIGCVLCDLLLREGFGVTILDCLKNGPEVLDGLAGRPGLGLSAGDCRDTGLLTRLVAGHDACVWLAALVGEKACLENPAAAFETNYLAALSAYECCLFAGGKRFVFASTDSCYGRREGETLTELSTLAPLSLYAELKARAEGRILTGPAPAPLFPPLAPGAGSSPTEKGRAPEPAGQAGRATIPTVLRLATVYGAAPRSRFDLAVNRLVRDAALGLGAKIFSGEQWRPFVHVRDAARAFVMTLKAPAPLVSGQVFNVGSNENNVQFKELAVLLKKVCPGADVGIVPRDPDLRDYFVDFTKIRLALGFVPSVTLEEGMADLRDRILGGDPPDPFDGRWVNA